jgi:hypothetical protein
MYRECRHIKEDGRRCRTGALKGKPYCYFHMNLKRTVRRPSIEIPPLEDSTSVLLGIGQVMRLLRLDTMDMKRAGLMLYGLQIASSVIKQREQGKPEDYVRSVHDEAGSPIDFAEALVRETPALASESTVCEPPQDCANCEQKASCTRLSQAFNEAAVKESLPLANPQASGHDFSRAEKKPKRDWALAPRPQTQTHLKRKATNPSQTHRCQGHDFSRAEKNPKSNWASSPASTSPHASQAHSDKPLANPPVSGHDFSRAERKPKSDWALAPVSEETSRASESDAIINARINQLSYLARPASSA